MARVGMGGRSIQSAGRVLALVCVAWVSGCGRGAQPAAAIQQDAALPEVSLSQSATSVTCYDFVEITVNVPHPSAPNPFTDVFVTGEFGLSNQPQRVIVDGFADSPDGKVFRIRFMPTTPGVYSYAVKYWQANREKTIDGVFRAVAGSRRGLVAADPSYPWHFVWTGTSEHYFLNGTTAFFLLGWDDEQVIRASIDRLHGLSVNRIRVLLDGRTDHFWTEPIVPGHGFRAVLNPWEAKRPDDARDPVFDYTKFNARYWQKFERMVRYARDRDVGVSAILDWNDSAVHPAAGSSDERRYIRYAVARLSAYSNITWDLGDDLDAFRSDAWTHETGAYLHTIDPYNHLATSHPTDNRHQDRTSDWFGMTSFQRWDRPLHAWMLQQRDVQRATGRIVPQLNEEYGYEDHYPDWAPYKAPAASADADRRAAWEISMAGAYQTTGETAKRGTGVAPDSGGGWVNGRGDSTMTMLRGYAHMVALFTSLEWWKADPHDELVNNGAMCLAEKGTFYVVYLPHGGSVTLTLEPGVYEMRWFNPRTGQYQPLPDAAGSAWTSPIAPDSQDWVVRAQRVGVGSAS
jgi:hypothetical protein